MRQTYGASVSTLRELLGRLASEELVTAEGQRGFEVAPISPEDLRELAALRLLLECHALGQSFAAGGLEWEGRVVAAHHKLAAMERRLLAGEPADAQAVEALRLGVPPRPDRAPAGRRRCCRRMRPSTTAYLRYQMVAVVFRGAVAAEEHQRLLDAALARDAAAARAVLETHVNGCVARVLATGALEAFMPGAPLAAEKETEGRRRARKAV